MRMKRNEVAYLKASVASSPFRSTFPGFTWGSGCGTPSFYLKDRASLSPKEPVTQGGRVLIPDKTLHYFDGELHDTGIPSLDTPLVDDYNLDGGLEVLLPQDGGILVLSEDFQELSFFEVEEPFTPLLVDVNADHRPELLVAWRGGITCFSLDGEMLWSRELTPLTLPAATYLGLSDYGSVVLVVEGGVTSLDLRTGELEWFREMEVKAIPPVMQDVNGDFVPEIFVASRGLAVLNSRGEVQEVVDVEPIAYPSIFDVDGDGSLEIAVPAEDGLHLIPGFKLEAEVTTPAMIADVDGDGWQEVVAGSEEGLLTVDQGEGYLYRVGRVLTVPVPADLDGDGCFEVVVITGDGVYVGKGGE